MRLKVGRPDIDSYADRFAVPPAGPDSPLRITFLGVAAAHLLLRTVPVVGRVAALPFLLAVVALWAMLIFKALRGQTYKLPFVGEIAADQLR